jgi:hypothetical protein
MWHFWILYKKTDRQTETTKMNIIRVWSELNKIPRVSWKVTLYKKLITLEINPIVCCAHLRARPGAMQVVYLYSDFTT